MKIEIAKPVIPQFVADYLRCAKADITFMRVMELAKTRNELLKWKKEYDWISENDEIFATAWIYGYEVEKEPLYYAKNKLTGQYLGDMASDEAWEYAPRWIVDKRDLRVEKMTKDEFRRIYGLDDTNVIFEEV